jgi:hypothetical protein
MSKSMFDPEGLQKDMAKAAASLMKFEDGQAKISGAASKMKLKALAEAAGMSQEELATQGQIYRKQEEIGKSLSRKLESLLKQ